MVLRPRLLIAKAAVAAAVGATYLLAGSSSAQAQPSPAPTVIYACVVPDGTRDGDANDGRLLRLVAANEACKRREVKISWNQIGPAGPAGANGAPGAPGAAGTNGAPGAVGPQGPAGTTGATGPLGPAGPVGPAGLNGTNGVDGAPGAMGPVGPAGANGTNGANGVDGAAGAAGANGTNGSDGAPGATGPIGPIGPTGANGSNGVGGAPGAMGPAGPAGATGAVGATGPAGPQGPAGAAGSIGPQGPTGANGTNGVDGAPGAIGPTGATGANGATGAQGPMGPAGPSGGGEPMADAMVTAPNIRVQFDGAAPFMAPQISQVGFSVAATEIPSQTAFRQFAPGRVTYDLVRILLSSTATVQPTANANAIQSVETWWDAVQQGSLQTRDVTISVMSTSLASTQQPAMSFTLHEAIPTSYDPFTKVVTLQVGGISHVTLTTYVKSAPFLAGLTYNLSINNSNYSAASPSGGVTQLEVVSGVGIGRKKITPFRVKSSPASGELLDWIDVAAAGWNAYRDIGFETLSGTSIYNFSNAFPTRVILIGPSLVTSPPGVAPVGLDLTVQPNGRE